MTHKKFISFLLSKATLYFIISILTCIAYWFWFKKEFTDVEVTDIINFISLLTFIAAIFIGYFELRKEYESGLPKLLTIRFLVDEKLVMVCKRAGLSHENDIRAWAQQIGYQMTGQNLKFTTKPQSLAYAIKEHQYGEKKIKFKCFYYELYLKEIKLKFESDVSLTQKVNDWIQKGKYLVWDALDNDETYEEKKNFKDQPAKIPMLIHSDGL